MQTLDEIKVVKCCALSANVQKVVSVTRSGDLLDFGRLFKPIGNN